jgi:cytochrome P450
MTPRKPVTDWTTDWDHLDPRWREDPYPIWDELRRSCPIAHTERYQGAYLPTRYEDVRAIANDSTHFSSRRVIVREARPEPMPSPPITSDPPHHKPYKQLLLPSFTAEAMTGLEPKARAICNELIDKIHRRGALRRRAAVHQAHPGQGDRPHAGRAGNRQRPVHQVDP